MIKLSTDCKDCIMSKTCKYKNNAKYAMEKLKTTIYGDGPNDDFYWDIMMQHYNVDVTFSCPFFTSEAKVRGVR